MSPRDRFTAVLTRALCSRLLVWSWDRDFVLAEQPAQSIEKCSAVACAQTRRQVACSNAQIVNWRRSMVNGAPLQRVDRLAPQRPSRVNGLCDAGHIVWRRGPLHLIVAER